jgi:flagellar biosynthesis/type III secretory pathway M-ring protein FliF/YscJ
MLLSAMQLQEASDVAKTATVAIIRESILGALLVFAVVLIVVLIRKLMLVQDLRVSDQKDMSRLLESATQRNSALSEKVSEALSGVKSALEQLNDTERHEQETVNRLCTLVDSVLREAVKRRTMSDQPPPRRGG